MNIQLQLFSNLHLLFSSLGVAELEKMYHDFTSTSDDICQAIRKIDPEADLSDFHSTSWTFDAAKGERITDSIIDGELIVHKENFDEWVLDCVKKEKNRIVGQLKEFFINCQSDFELKQKAFFYINENTSLQESLTNFRNPFLSKDFATKVEEILYEIENFLKRTIEVPMVLKDKTGGKVRPNAKSLIAEKKPAKLHHLYEKLKEAGFIQDSDDKSDQFKSIFSGATTSKSNDRIIWKNQRALKFFFQSLENITFSIKGIKGKKAFTIPDNKWVWVNQYFIKPNEKDFKNIGNDTKKLSSVTAGMITNILNDLYL